MLQQITPDFAAQMQSRQAELPPEVQENGQITPEQTEQLFAMSQMMNRQSNQNQGGVLTKAAAESLMRNMSPAI